MLNRLKLGAKLSSGFGLLILIALLLGGLAVYNMYDVAGQSTMLAQEYVPEVGLAISIERNTLSAMMDLKAYGINSDENLLKSGNEKLAKVKQRLDEAAQLAEASPHLVKLPGQIKAANAALDQYNKLIQDTVNINTAIDKGREDQSTAAQAYRKECNDYLASMNEIMVNEIGQGLEAAKLVDRLAKINKINDIIELGNEVRVANYKGQATGDLKMLQEAIANFAEINSRLDELKKITRQEANLKQLEAIRGASEQYKKGISDYIANWQASDQLAKTRLEAANGLLAAADATSRAGMDGNSRIANQAMNSLNQSAMIMVIGLLIALIVGVVLAITFTRSITKPLMAVTAEINRTASGDLTVSLEDVYQRRGDELGEMARNVVQMSNDLSDVMRQIMSASGTVATGSEQISSGNQDLSQRVQEQASAIEETAATIEEMTSSIKQNAENANAANGLARQTSELAVEGGQVVDEAITAMGRVSESSRKINDIVDMVNEIAFQTNLLALNASVEAARAGEAGRGFAVVAGEVRNLAQRSADAAKEIQSLIKESVNRVDEGNDLVSRSGDTLKEIIDNVRRVADTVSEISAASQEQSSAIDQINIAVSQLDEVTQQNASLVEETAAASENMNAEAVGLQNLVVRFKVDSGAPATRPKAIAAPKPAAKPKAKPAAKPKAKAAGKAAPKAMVAGPEVDDFLDSEELDGFEKF